MPEFNIKLIEGGSRATLGFRYRGDGKVLELQSLTKQLESSEIGQFYIYHSEVKELVEKYNHFVTSLSDPSDGIGTDFTDIIAERRSACLQIVIADDKMSASAHIQAAYGGTHISANQIVKQAQESGINFGFDKKAIVALAARASKGQLGANHKGVIANAKQPIQGVSAKVEQLVECFKDRVLKPQIKHENTDAVNMRDLGMLTSVKPGDPVMRKVPMLKGQIGITVTGEVLETSDGSDLELNPGPGCEISADDPNLIVANITGMPRRIENGMAVEDTFEVPSVDVSVGNIDYEGSVIVSGNVGEGMLVKANGDVNITGYVDNATIIAKGDVFIGKAAIGKHLESGENMAYSTKIKADGNIFIRHAQYIDVVCGQQLSVEKQLLHSRIQAKNVIVGVEDSPHGKLIGGKVLLTGTLKCGILGAPAGTVTEVNFNYLFDKITAKCDQLRNDIEDRRDILENIKIAVEHLKEESNSNERKVQLTEAIQSFDKHKKILTHLQAKSKALDKKLKSLFDQTGVEVTERVYPGVYIKIGNEQTRTKREYGASKAALVDNKLRIEPLIHH